MFRWSCLHWDFNETKAYQPKGCPNCFYGSLISHVFLLFSTCESQHVDRVLRLKHVMFHMTDRTMEGKGAVPAINAPGLTFSATNLFKKA